MKSRQPTFALSRAPITKAKITSVAAGIAGLLACLLHTPLSAEERQNCNNNMPRSSSPSEYDLQNPLEVRDLSRKLVWERCSWGQHFSNGRCHGTPIALTYAQAEQIVQQRRREDRHHWQIPNLWQLASIVELACHQPALNLAVFPNTPAATFWTSTAFANRAQRHWAINFVDGGNQVDADDNKSYLRMLYLP